MTKEEPSDGATGAPRSGRGDIGRRVALRRRQLGLTVKEAATRAGTAPGYLEYLEAQPADPSSGTLIRLAVALETTVADLRGGGVDLPGGIGRAAYRPELRELSPEECRARLSTHGVGRVAVTAPDGPAIIPVNYTVVDDTVVFRTAAGAAPAAAVGSEVAFEVDHIDEALSTGWSVLVVGPARIVTEPEAVRRITGLSYSRPWAGGDRGLWVSIDLARVTGRRIHVP